MVSAGRCVTVRTTFESVLSRVSGRRKTLSVYNADLSPEARRRIEAYFEPQQVRLRSAGTDDGRPRNFAVLHDGDEFVAAADLSTLAGALDVESGVHAAANVDEVEYPERSATASYTRVSSGSR